MYLRLWAQIYEILCHSSDGVTREIYPTAQIDVGAETAGKFLTHYLSGNGRIIPIIGQISINGSVKLLGIPADTWGCGFTFIENVQYPSYPTVWGHGGTSNNNRLVTPGGTYIKVTVACGNNVSAHPSYMPRSPENPRIAARCVCDDFRCLSRREIERRRFISCNTILNPRVNCCGDAQEGPVTQ